MKMDVTYYVLGGGALGCGWLAWVIFEGTECFRTVNYSYL